MKYSLYRVIAVVLLSSGTSAADPITVTSGSAIFTNEPSRFEVAGTAFSLSTVFAPGLVSGTHWFDHCASGCAPGTVVDFGTTTYSVAPPEGDFTGLPGTVNGVDYPQLFSAGEVTFTGPTIAIPLFPSDPDGLLRLHGEFEFQGNVSLFSTPSRTGPPVFSSELTGRGTARAFLIPVYTSPNLFQVVDLAYTFAPVPEPSTLAMLVPGLIGVATVLRGRRTRARTDQAEG